jgi:hypothetical protein
MKEERRASPLKLDRDAYPGIWTPFNTAPLSAAELLTGPGAKLWRLTSLADALSLFAVVLVVATEGLTAAFEPLPSLPRGLDALAFFGRLEDV